MSRVKAAGETRLWNGEDQIPGTKVKSGLLGLWAGSPLASKEGTPAAISDRKSPPPSLSTSRFLNTEPRHRLFYEKRRVSNFLLRIFKREKPHTLCGLKNLPSNLAHGAV